MCSWPTSSSRLRGRMRTARGASAAGTSAAALSSASNSRSSLTALSLTRTLVEATDLAPRRGSVVWRYSGDARLIATGAHAILLQVAHPTVGAGVTEHSNFRADPWGRLLRTLDYSYVMVYGGPAAAAEMGRRLREMHREIRGDRSDGRPYHALEPEAFAWVHATLADSIVRGNELLARPLGDGVERFWEEWRRYGRLIGVRDGDLPASWGQFQGYFEEMVEERLERTAAVDEVLESLSGRVAP